MRSPCYYPIFVNSFYFQIITDRLFVTGTQKSIKLQSKTTSSPIYMYYYKFPVIYGLEESMSKRDIDLGIAHGDDIILYYDTPIRNSLHPLNDEEKLMQTKLIDFYYNYIRFGYVNILIM